MIMWYHGITINPITVNYFIDIPLSNVRHISFKLYTLFLKANRIYRITSIKRPLLLNAPQRGRLFETFCYFPGKTCFYPV